MPTAPAGATFGSVLRSLISFRYGSRKGQLEPYPPRPSHRRLIAVALVVIIAGGAFLFFWQAVTQFAGPLEYGDEFCIQTLSQFQPELQISDFVEASLPGEEIQRFDASFFDEIESRIFSIEKVGEQTISCSVQISTSSQQGGYSDAYQCDIVTVSYRSQESGNFLLAASQSEFPEEIELAGLPRYNYKLTYFNPDAKDRYDALLGQFRAHSCDVQ